MIAVAENRRNHGHRVPQPLQSPLCIGTFGVCDNHVPLFIALNIDEDNKGVPLAKDQRFPASSWDIHHFLHFFYDEETVEKVEG